MCVLFVSKLKNYTNNSLFAFHLYTLFLLYFKLLWDSDMVDILNIFGNLDFAWRMFLRIFASLCRYNLKKLTYEERKAKLVARLQALNSAAGDDEDDDE